MAILKALQLQQQQGAAPYEYSWSTNACSDGGCCNWIETRYIHRYGYRCHRVHNQCRSNLDRTSRSLSQCDTFGSRMSDSNDGSIALDI